MIGLIRTGVRLSFGIVGFWLDGFCFSMDTVVCVCACVPVCVGFSCRNFLTHACYLVSAPSITWARRQRLKIVKVFNARPCYFVVKGHLTSETSVPCAQKCLTCTILRKANAHPSLQTPRPTPKPSATLNSQARLYIHFKLGKRTVLEKATTQRC